MRKDHAKCTIVLIVIVLGVLTAKFGALWWTERQWFDLQAQQLATIERIGEHPPTGWDRATWQNAIVTPYNVWGNVTYHPKYSKISNEEMRSLQRKLERIVAETTPDNSIESVDRVFQLLLQRGQKVDFISGYRNEFRLACGDDLIPVRDDLLGSWSEDLGRIADLSRDSVLTFEDDGTLTISQQSETFVMQWDCPVPGQLVLINESGHRIGPFQVVIERRELPLGNFDVLESSGALLPFGRKRFSRIPKSAS